MVLSKENTGTLLKWDLTLLDQSELPKSFWLEAFQTSIHIINRLPIKVPKISQTSIHIINRLPIKVLKNFSRQTIQKTSIF
jgi:hypothetical protein